MTEKTQDIVEIKEPRKDGFHLYFAGSQNKISEKMMQDNNNFRLMSYLNDQGGLRERRELGLKTFVDSGAFSAFTQGAEIDIDEYIKWLNKYDEYVLIAAELDMIPGKWGHEKTKADLEEAAEYSWENYLYMIERCKSPEKILPIFHQGEDFKHLERMLEYDSPKVEYLGISPSNEESTNVKEVWIERVFETIHASSNPEVKTHAFGMTSLKVLERQPFTSADSTSWILTGATGSIMTPYGTVIVSENQRGNKMHIANMPKPAQEHIEGYAKKHGYEMAELSADYKARVSLNIEYLTEWSENYKYKPLTAKQTRLF